MKDQKGISTAVVLVVVIMVLTAGFLIARIAVAPSPTDEPTPDNSGVVCTLDAKLCPDGSYVGRTGPKCEFAPCPTVTPNINSGITGTVSIGPTCPVQRVDDPSCDDKPYQFGEFIITQGIKAEEVMRFTTNDKGQYAVSLPAGNYTIESASQVGIGQQLFDVTVKAGVVTEFDFTLDTGIR